MSYTNYIKQNAISMLAHMISSGEIFDKLRKQVLELEYEDLTGPEKKDKAIEFIKEDLTGVAKVVLNLLLELSVMYVQLQTNKLS